jgi:hypothetical protein
MSRFLTTCQSVPLVGWNCQLPWLVCQNCWLLAEREKLTGEEPILQGFFWWCSPFLGYFPKMKLSLWNNQSVCMSVYPPNNLWNGRFLWHVLGDLDTIIFNPVSHIPYLADVTMEANACTLEVDAVPAPSSLAQQWIRKMVSIAEPDRAFLAWSVKLGDITMGTKACSLL